METYGYNDSGNPRQQTPHPDYYRSEKKIPAALLGILLGCFGANKFYLGYISEGIIQVVLNIVTCGIATVIPLIEGIIYLTLSDRDFDHTYVEHKKGWL